MTCFYSCTSLILPQHSRRAFVKFKSDHISPAQNLSVVFHRTQNKNKLFMWPIISDLSLQFCKLITVKLLELGLKQLYSKKILIFKKDEETNKQKELCKHVVPGESQPSFPASSPSSSHVTVLSGFCPSPCSSPQPPSPSFGHLRTSSSLPFQNIPLNCSLPFFLLVC